MFIFSLLINLHTNGVNTESWSSKNFADGFDTNMKYGYYDDKFNNTDPLPRDPLPAVGTEGDWHCGLCRTLIFYNSDVKPEETHKDCVIFKNMSDSASVEALPRHITEETQNEKTNSTTHNNRIDMITNSSRSLICKNCHNIVGLLYNQTDPIKKLSYFGIREALKFQPKHVASKDTHSRVPKKVVEVAPEDLRHNNAPTSQSDSSANSNEAGNLQKPEVNVKDLHPESEKKVTAVNPSMHASGEFRRKVEFLPIPETTSYSESELKTNNWQLLDKIEVTKQVKSKYSYGNRIKISTFDDDEGELLVGATLKVCGWAKSMRAAAKGSLYFIDLNDGSSVKNLQVVVSKDVMNFEKLKSEGVGTSLSFVGNLVRSPKKEQKYELQVKYPETHFLNVFGSCPQDEYPLSKKKHSFEFLREKMHLRPRTNTIGTVSRLRSALSMATHEYFQKRGFQYVNTPMITTAD